MSKVLLLGPFSEFYSTYVFYYTVIWVGNSFSQKYLFLDVRFSQEVQGAYKLMEYFAKPYVHKYWTEIHDVTTIRKRNVCSFISDHDV
jgi:hypothetical protein